MIAHAYVLAKQQHCNSFASDLGMLRNPLFSHEGLLNHRLRSSSLLLGIYNLKKMAARRPISKNMQVRSHRVLNIWLGGEVHLLKRV